MSHPAGDHIGVGKRAVWYGTEVEGKHALGEPTAFIDRWPEQHDLIDLIGRLKWREITHVFITEAFRDYGLFSTEILPVCWEMGAKATIATLPGCVEDLLRCPWIKGVCLMVRATFDAGWIRSLRPGDQVTVGIPYDLMTWSVDDGVRTVPKDYLEDKC